MSDRKDLAWTRSMALLRPISPVLKSELPEAQRVPPWEWRDGGKQTAQVAPAERNALACGAKRYCSEMVSCEEARHYLAACGLTRLDGNNDGVPCDALC